MEYLFDLERAVEAVENRVPLGKPGMKLLLSGALIYALFYVFRALTLDLFWPLAQFVVHVGFAFPAFSEVNTSRLAEGFVVGSLAGAAAYLGNHVLSKMIARIRDLESAVDKYQSLFWSPTTRAQEQALHSRFLAIGPSYSLRIASHENTDCGVFAHQLYLICKSVGWTVVGPTVGTWESIGTTGIRVKAKNVGVGGSVAEAISDSLLVDIGLAPIDDKDACDIVITIGPKWIDDSRR